MKNQGINNKKNFFFGGILMSSVFSFMSLGIVFLLFIFGVVISILILIIYNMRYKSGITECEDDFGQDNWKSSKSFSENQNGSIQHDKQQENNVFHHTNKQSELHSRFHVHNDYYENKKQIHGLEKNYVSLKQKYTSLVERVNTSPPEIKNFLIDRTEETYNSEKLKHKIDLMKKEWTKPKATHAVWIFNPIFATLEKTVNAEHAYNYAGRPYYSVDQIIDIFEEMLKPWKNSRYLWDALEWLEKTYVNGR